MHLGKLRLRLTLLYSVIGALVCLVMVVVGVHIGSQREKRDAERELEYQLLEAMQPGFIGQPHPELDNVWLVRINKAKPEERSIDAFQKADPAKPTVEPPLYNLAQEALKADITFDHFVQQGTSFATYARRLDDSSVIVAALPDQPLEDAISSLRTRLILLGLLVTAGAGAAGWFVAGRSLRPAMEAKSLQQDFLADAAHEMRTPLAVIQASASQALSRPRTSEEYVRSLAEIRSASERAASGVSELLDLARFDNGQAIPRLAPLRLDLLAEEVTAAVRVDGCEIVCDVGPSVVVEADIALLRQAIENVVRNAARRSANVRINSTIDGRFGSVTIADDGPGFAPESLPYVFERFRRGDERGSAGLGLAIVKSIMVAHGGNAMAGNQIAGGAIITLSLPLARPKLAG